ncbi:MULTISPECIES: hypothetical protein [Pseudonocardia]|uniref:Uncharacterized protein n=2 Tax=Pseudonocardia TaxID=1847 RepID=A0A1Y2N4Y0_PSEAH|nr:MULTISPECIES: hypothetical protein [Pseudonocardia]OSY42525.1 hypothetical protein BG845_01445 [Pseudonocardia autotrophica]TDN76044.1 hypothetical protein C8E95_5230 [Pseudonocardia autotrophica]BBG00021.1 hypothetical protein Pdca_12300 [Pseudonocardia autotrophica]GEC28063.1 hypothetical protein PSA01_50920 [Pseudonocardia saturnea]
MKNLTMAPAVPAERPSTHRDHTATLVNQENAMTLIHEALARSHQQEALREAAEYRFARRLSAARRWTRLASWVSARAARARARARVT